ncbi:uncharacterized protein LOC120430432 isoform X1 [Culex pipiens pallens]|uniref:uncharacterized protein LOC120430432 isoform X1 n=1 Tax=Culex pipiens pallens TaxID=42434 RepID=UPI001952E19C|nr:uncharacterized protein LOC120430432 isoform X1 [Culex pipiens pallens]XP_039451473.1 uncharacterized protein LOC120430432 isoform X1 [Culex pipiens pallens]XP_039451474.1 uncharacterized protein LOC120430432 isoform X1 [Culex pipiens pallens]XP_039451475.1 uncharacterized protein LOC120430432 isoform X1 [Culex pipiens pallens]XP_039451476.1 uncharacterized protein LOC120430432 isoform X1 [Culex pipiens pallens]
MYPPTVVVLALALVSCGSRQALSLETLLRLEQLDGDGEGGGLGDLGSSSTFEDTAYDTDSEDNASSSYPQQPPAGPLDGVFYRVTPASDQESQERTLLASPTSSTTGNSILPEEEDASVEDQQQVTDKIAGLAQPFIGGTSEDDLHDTASRSRSLDHEPSPIDTLQSPSTVLETSLSTNYLYTSSGSSSFFNDTYHHSTTSDTASSELDASSLDVSSSEDQSTTTNLPSLSLGPDDVTAPKPTKPHFDESKISKAELLSLLIADKNLRLPIAFLVDTCNDSLSYSKKVFDAALVPRSPLEVILMRYNATGIAKSTSFRNTKSLMDSINALQPSYDGSGRAYYGILRTSQEIPYDSAIFLATSNPATDKELAKMAALTLLKKRIRLYVIWFGDEVDMNLSDQHLDSQTGLHELAFKTGGRVIRFEIDRNFGNNPVLTTLVSESELRGDTSIPIPVPEDVNSLYFKLHGALDAATLRTPNGFLIDLLHNTVSEEHHPANDPPSSLPIPTPKIIASNHTKQTYGQHRSRALLPHGLEREQDYLFVVSRVDNHGHEGGTYYLNVSGANEAVVGPKSNDSYGVTVKADFRTRHGFELLELGDPALERHYDERNGGGNGLLDPKIAGRSQRQTLLPQDGGTEESGTLGRATLQAITKVDLGTNSQLNGPRGSTLQLIFEVTNFRQTPMQYFFRVNDELSYLRALNPGSATIAPDQTVNVVVTLVINPNAEVGARDKVTFSTEGVDRVSQAAFVTVTDSTGLSDSYQPSLWYTYSSRCEGRSSPGTCAGAFWTVEITARDYETGLLRISSSPRGIVYKAPFTAGTRDDVKATYTASCCQPKVTITATDVSRNARTVSLDVTDIWLNEAGIAAVVLGVLLLIALIVLLVILIRYCVRRRKRAQELPIYRSDARGTRSTR